MTSLDSMLGAILGAPALPGAKCRGRHHLFDDRHPDETPDTREQRHNAALTLCRNCPALNPCAAWFDRLRPSQRPEGVIAGRVHVRKFRTKPMKRSTQQ